MCAEFSKSNSSSQAFGKSSLLHFPFSSVEIVPLNKELLAAVALSLSPVPNRFPSQFLYVF